MEFTLKIMLGKDFAANYSELNTALRQVTRQIQDIYIDSITHRLPIPEFKPEACNVLKHDLLEPPLNIGQWKVAPSDQKLSDRLLTVFPWLAEEDETSISGADTLEELQQLFTSLTAEGC